MTIRRVMAMVMLMTAMAASASAAGHEGRRGGGERRGAAHGEARGRAGAERPAWYERGQHAERFNRAASGEVPKRREPIRREGDPPPTPRPPAPKLKY